MSYTITSLTPAAARSRSHCLQKKLARQVAIPALLALTQAGVAACQVLYSGARPPNPLWLLLALGVGLAFGHAVRLFWSAEAFEIRLASGQVLLTLSFLTVSFGTRAVLIHVFDLNSSDVLVLSVASSLMLGHCAGLLGGIRRTQRSLAR
jgi:hypothetical protein